MRVLVTRPEAEAERTAQALRERGCEPVLAPVSVVEPVAFTLPDGPFAGVLLSSQNAVRHGVAHAPASVRALRVFAVGERTTDAARQAGCVDVFCGPGDAAGLAGAVAAAFPPGARLIYLAGEPRKPALERELAARGYLVETVVVYRAEAATALPASAQAALAGQALDAVLHYSREGAARFLRLAGEAGLSAQAMNLRHLCLSRDVAEVFEAGAGIQIANEPNEEFLLKLLDDCRSQR